MMMVTAAKSTASLFLSIDRTKDGTGKAPSAWQELELAAVGACGKAAAEALGECICRTGAKTAGTTIVRYTAPP